MKTIGTYYNYIVLGIVIATFLTLLPAPVNAQTIPQITTTYVTATTTNDRQGLLDLIENLTKQIAELKKQLAQKRAGESNLTDGLWKGVTHNDVIKVQKLLATDPTVYPEGIVTGYYGEMTRKAVVNFQLRHGVTPTGEIGTETKVLMQNYLKRERQSRFPY